MALKVIDRPRFTAVVTLATVMLQGTLKVEFEARRTSETQAMENEAIAAGKGPEHLLYALVKGFEPIELPDGTTLLYDGAESLGVLLDYPGASTALIKAYHRGLWEEAKGN